MRADAPNFTHWGTHDITSPVADVNVVLDYLVGTPPGGTTRSPAVDADTYTAFTVCTNAGVDTAQSRYDLVAVGLECHGELAASPAEVGPAFDRALKAVAKGKTALVNVLSDPETGGLRADPNFQMVPFNHAYHAKIARRHWVPEDNNQ